MPPVLPSDPALRAFIEERVAFDDDLPVDADLAVRRRAYERAAAHFRGPLPAHVLIEDLLMPGGAGHVIPARLYRPQAAPRPAAALVFYHGGGWIYGSIDSHHDICADLAAATGLVVVSVGYRLAPEHPFPAAFDDALAALIYLADLGAAFAIDPARLLVGGDSAGGNLAAAVALAVRDRALLTLCGQVLIYPALAADCSAPSYTTMAEAPLLRTADIVLMQKSYWHEVTPPNAYAAPLLAERFDGLAPAVITAAGLDPLHDDAPAFAERLAGAGVPVTTLIEPDLVHGHLRARSTVPTAEAAFARLCAAVRALNAAS